MFCKECNRCSLCGKLQAEHCCPPQQVYPPYPIYPWYVWYGESGSQAPPIITWGTARVTDGDVNASSAR